MSTRSGKRIHGSFIETPNDAEEKLALKSEKKAKNKRFKENCSDTVIKPKKRDNYVSFPTSKDNYDNTNAAQKKTRESLRVDHKVTLKEQNLNVSLNIGEVSLDSKTTTRQSRRAKRSAEKETGESVANGIIKELPKEKNKKSKKGKKKKAKSASTVANETKDEQVELPKKSKKKKLKADIQNASPNKSNGSVDSFHSAAGSPEPLQSKVEVPQETLRKSPRRSSKRSKPDDITDGDILNYTNPKRSKKSKLANHSNDITNEETNKSIGPKQSNVSENKHAVDSESHEVEQEILDIHFEKEPRRKRKSSLKNNTSKQSGTPTKLNTTFEKTHSPDKLNVTYERDNDMKKSLRSRSTLEKPVSLNSTFDKSKESGQLILNTTFDKETKLDSTSENTERKSDSKSLISSDGTINLTFDKSNNCSKISITSDDSNIENIVNTTPVLIESSMDVSREPDSSPVLDKTPETSNDKLNTSAAPQTPNGKLIAATPLKREGTFTKEGPEVIMSPKPKLSAERTPVKPMSLPSAGCTPFHVTKSSHKEKSILNLTHSIEKAGRRSSLVEPVLRMTKVMFCSPINNLAVVMQQKRKVIKSNLKGSDKSFIFDESAVNAGTAGVAGPRKRSYTHSDVEARVKRSRLADGLQTSVDRLSRPRTSSATVKLSEPSTPSKKPLPTKSPTPSKASEAKPARTKLPNFAALHQKQFARMESLDECQLRRARRARLLRTPTGGVAVLARTSRSPQPPVSVLNGSPAKPIKEPVKKTGTPTKAPKAAAAPPPALAKFPNLPTLETLRPGFTRFGFRMHTDANPFSVPATTAKPKEIKPNGLVKRQHTLPSLKGTTSQRKEIAKQTVMREKSFTSLSDKRNVKRTETRTMIKGVRTNRRFELQMMLRNINA